MRRLGFVSILLVALVASAPAAETIPRDQVVDALVAGLVIEPLLPVTADGGKPEASRPLPEVQAWARKELAVLGPQVLPESLPWVSPPAPVVAVGSVSVTGDLGELDLATLRLSLFTIRLASARQALSEPVAGQPGPADAAVVAASIRPLHDAYVKLIARLFGVPADDATYAAEAASFLSALSSEAARCSPERRPWRAITDDRRTVIEAEMQAALTRLLADFAKETTDHGRLTDETAISERVAFYRPIFCNRALNVWGEIARRETTDPRQHVEDETLVPGITAARTTWQDLHTAALMARIQPQPVPSPALPTP